MLVMCNFNTKWANISITLMHHYHNLCPMNIYIDITHSDELPNILKTSSLSALKVIHYLWGMQIQYTTWMCLHLWPELCKPLNVVIHSQIVPQNKHWMNTVVIRFETLMCFHVDQYLIKTQHKAVAFQDSTTERHDCITLRESWHVLHFPFNWSIKPGEPWNL